MFPLCNLIIALPRQSQRKRGCKRQIGRGQPESPTAITHVEEGSARVGQTGVAATRAGPNRSGDDADSHARRRKDGTSAQRASFTPGGRTCASGNLDEAVAGSGVWVGENAGVGAVLRLLRPLPVPPTPVVHSRREEQETAKQPHRIPQQQVPASGLLLQNRWRIAQPGDYSPVVDWVLNAVQRQEQSCRPDRGDQQSLWEQPASRPDRRQRKQSGQRLQLCRSPYNHWIVGDRSHGSRP
jgi:hypothetical protein